MKDKILTFIIGMLIGAIIATAVFYFYSKNNDSGNVQIEKGGPGQMQSGEGMPSGNPPEKPDGDMNGQPPSMPSQENTTTSNNNI